MEESALESKMQQVVDLVATDISSIRTGKVAPTLISELEIMVYGGTQRLKVKELATIAVSDASMLTVEPWDKSIIGEIKKGIEVANVGLNPSIDGEIIRISVPPLTSEDRESYVKLLHTKIESGRIMIRQIRGDSMRDIKESFEKKELGEDEKFQQEKHLQEITDKHIKKIDQVGKSKELELLQL